MENFSLADIKAVTDGNGYGADGFGGGWMWIIVLFIIMWGGGGLWGNRNGEPVTESGLCNAMNFNDLENAVGRLSDNQAAIARQTDNAICNLGYSALQQTNETQRQIADCCCTTQRGIDSINFNGALNTAAINENTTAQVQKVLDVLCQNRMADMQGQINQLQLQSALCGVIRYPNATTYTAGNWPFGYANNGCGCGCNGYGFAGTTF